jgi:hypothetical protein
MFGRVWMIGLAAVCLAAGANVACSSNSTSSGNTPESEEPGDDASTAPDSSNTGDSGGGGKKDAGSTDSGPIDAAPNSLEFGATCSADEQCKSGLCHDFKAKGSHCSMLCPEAGPDKCPPGSYGCTGPNNPPQVCKFSP